MISAARGRARTGCTRRRYLVGRHWIRPIRTLAPSLDMVPDHHASQGIAPGRLQVGRPIAIIDIGSNSVRLVAYEGLTRAPTPIYNEKVLCGLDRNVAT